MNNGTRQLLTELHEDDSVQASVIFDTDDDWELLTASNMLYRPYECSVIFDGAADEEFIIATDNLELVHQAMMKDIMREYLANPTSAWGWSIEWHQLVDSGEELRAVRSETQTDPVLSHRFSPDPV